MIAWLWLLLVLQSGEVERPASPPPVKGADLTLLDDVRQVAGRIRSMRGFGFDRAPVAVRASSEARRVAAEILVARSVSGDRLEARGRAWADVGLGDPATPRNLYVHLARDLEGLAIDPIGSRLLVDPDLLTLSDFTPTEENEDASLVLMATGVRPDEPLIVHGLVHLHQDEIRGSHDLPETSDAILAHRAWAEGEANVVAMRYLFQAMGLEDEVLDRSLDPGSAMDGRLVPASIDQLEGAEGVLLDWVYRDGFAGAARRYRAGGWAALRTAVLASEGSRDVVHVDRPLHRPESIPDPRSGLSEEFVLVDRDRLGEIGVVVAVSSWAGKDNLGLLAGDGWTGDALFRWERPDGEDGITLWITRWSTPEEAEDFEYGYRRALASRFPSAKRTETEEGLTLVEAPERIIRVARKGREVRVRVHPPGLQLPEVTVDAAPLEESELSGVGGNSN